MIVLDASAVLEFLLGTPAGADIARRMASPRETLHAAYLALAEALAAPLLTADARLGRARGHRARIEVVSAT